jgi:hypothetical protein
MRFLLFKKKEEGRTQYIYIHTHPKFETLIYFKVLMEREKEKRSFIATYI